LGLSQFLEFLVEFARVELISGFFRALLDNRFIYCELLLHRLGGTSEQQDDRANQHDGANREERDPRSHG
jgi:hypothetical protein